MLVEPEKLELCTGTVEKKPRAVFEVCDVAFILVVVDEDVSELGEKLSL